MNFFDKIDRYIKECEEEKRKKQRLIKDTQHAKIGWKVIHQRKIGGYFSEWRKYFEYIDTHPDATQQEIESETGIHWRGTIYMRYLGLISIDKQITPPGRKFYQNPKYIHDILQQQLEKWYYCIDEFFEKGDSAYGLYPFIFIIKILLELGFDSEFKITLDEFRYFVITGKKYSDWQERVGFIKGFKEHPEMRGYLEKIFSDTSIDRILNLLRVSKFLEINNSSIGLKIKFIDVAKKIITEYEKLERLGEIPHYRKDSKKYFFLFYNDDSIIKYSLNSGLVEEMTNQILKMERKKKITKKDEENIEKGLIQFDKPNKEETKKNIQNILNRRKSKLPLHLKKRIKLQTKFSEEEAEKYERSVGKALVLYYGCCQIEGYGKDIPSNIVILCPNHHRQFHYDDAQIVSRQIISANKEKLIVKLCAKEETIFLDREFGQ